MSETTGDFRVRAYMAKSTALFMRDTFGEQELDRILYSVSPGARAAATSVKPADWCPVGEFSELLRALAAKSNDDSDHARERLIACGEFIAREATNTFLKIAMKMLTPGLFAKKLPDIWKRDCSSGTFDVEAARDKMTFRLSGMKGFDHVPCTAAGFVKFALGAMGKTVDTVQIQGWSLAEPCADGALVELTWKG
jgi:hypothetical protein